MTDQKTFSLTTSKRVVVWLMVLLVGLLVHCKSGKRPLAPAVTDLNNGKIPVEFKEEVVTFDQVNRIIQNKKVVLVDVRKKERYSQGHLKFALNIAISDSSFYTQISNLNKAHHYLIYGDGKEETNQAAAVFRAKGFESIKRYEAGWQDWVNRRGNIDR